MLKYLMKMEKLPSLSMTYSILLSFLVLVPFVLSVMFFSMWKSLAFFVYPLAVVFLFCMLFPKEYVRFYGLFGRIKRASLFYESVVFSLFAGMLYSVPQVALTAYFAIFASFYLFYFACRHQQEKFQGC